MICEFVKGMFAALEICTPFLICINILVIVLEGSYGITMVLVASYISMGVMVLYESYILFSSYSVVVYENPTFSLANTST